MRRVRSLLGGTRTAWGGRWSPEEKCRQGGGASRGETRTVLTVSGAGRKQPTPEGNSRHLGETADTCAVGKSSRARRRVRWVPSAPEDPTA